MQIYPKIIFLPRKNCTIRTNCVILHRFFVKKMKLVYRVFIGICLILVPLMASAQFVAPKYKPEKLDTLTSAQRLSFRTNTLEWALMMPNLAVEFDLSSSPYNPWTLGVSGRVNWETNPKVLTYNVFNILEGKVELRRYWHTRQLSSSYSGMKSLFSPERKNPRYWRAYYWGVYAAAGSFNFKFSHEGKQGTAYQGGASFGMSRNLFQYAKTCLDLEVGISAGLLYWTGDKYMLDRDANAYVATATGHSAVRPVIQDIRLALVYRIGPSVKKRHLYNQEKATLLDQQKQEKQTAHKEKKAAKEAAQKDKKAVKDAAQKEKKAAQQAKKAEKTAQKDQKLHEKMTRKYDLESTESVEPTEPTEPTETSESTESSESEKEGGTEL